MTAVSPSKAPIIAPPMTYSTPSIKWGFGRGLMTRAITPPSIIPTPPKTIDTKIAASEYFNSMRKTRTTYSLVGFACLTKFVYQTRTDHPRRAIPHRITHQNATVAAANASEASFGSAM
jgi:hypothetical protein